MNKTISIIITILVIGGIIWFGVTHRSAAPSQTTSPTPTTQTPSPTAQTPTTTLYACNAGKTITAAYTEGTPAPTPAPGEPPTPTGTVALTLSDGRTMTLKQTISADGVRYSNGDPQIKQGQPGSETFVFWSKGNGALVLENNQEKSYIGCIKVANDPGNLSQVYANSEYNFSIRLPNGYTPDAKYTYQASGPNKIIHGVKFTIPQSMTKGTNLGSDSYVSVEEIPQTQSCTADKFLYVNGEAANAAPQTITDADTTYSFLTSTDAGAGNRYEESVYAIVGTNPCVAVRYLIHYAVFENYPPGTVQQFDEAALKQQFDAIRRTLVLNQ